MDILRNNDLETNTEPEKNHKVELIKRSKKVNKQTTIQKKMYHLKDGMTNFGAIGNILT